MPDAAKPPISNSYYGELLCCIVITAEDSLSDAPSFDDQGLEESSQSISPRRRRQRRSSRQQLDSVSADPDTRRCRSLSGDRDRQEYSAARTADDMDMMDGVQPLAQADAGPADNGIAAIGRSALSQSVDSVVSGAASSNKRKAVATLPGNEEKSHRASL